MSKVVERFSKLFACSAIACIKLNNETILTNSVSNVYKEHGSVLLNKFKQFAQLDNYLPGHSQGDATEKRASCTRQIVIELGKLLRRMVPCSLYLFDTELVKIGSLLSLIQAIAEQANSLENRSTRNL